MNTRNDGAEATGTHGVETIPKRFPPPLMRSRLGSDGLRYPVTEPPFIECGATVTLRGIGPVVCIRRKGHPVSLTFGHTNGYEQWCFDVEQDREGQGNE